MPRRKICVPRSRSQKHRSLPQLEQLEDRSVPSVSPLGVAIEVESDPIIRIAATPNDFYYGGGSQSNQLWGLNNTGQTVGTPGIVDADIDAPEAWDVTTGSTSVTIGVIDTGIDYTHPDLYLNIWINQDEIPSSVKNAIKSNTNWDIDNDGLITFWDLNDTRNQGKGKITDLNRNGRIDAGDILKPVKQGGWANGIDEDSWKFAGTSTRYVDDLVGWNFVTNKNDPFDDNSHGTHVAGTIGAIGNNDLGVVGVNWKTQMAALKFLNRVGSGYTSYAANAINYAVANGMRVTNNTESRTRIATLAIVGCVE